jgi:quinol-cytochrome oxidoreductase complex cytochrome b subunit
MFLGEKFRPSWLTAWISGILLTLTAIALSWTAMLLDWTQVGYWRFQIELGTLDIHPGHRFPCANHPDGRWSSEYRNCRAPVHVA